MKKFNNLVKQCSGCIKGKFNLCIAIEEPKYFWEKYGYCFARSDDKDFQKKLYDSSKEYYIVKRYSNTF